MSKTSKYARGYSLGRTMEGNEREGSVAGQFHNFGLNLLLCFKVFTTRDSYSIRILTMTKMMMMLC